MKKIYSKWQIKLGKTKIKKKLPYRICLRGRVFNVN